MLTDDEIGGMTAAERRELILRLRTPVESVLPAPATLRRRRGTRMLLTVGGSILLVPWTIYLAVSLPSRVVVDGWQMVWVGYDILLLIMLATTAWFGWKRRLATVLLLFGTGVLVVSDAWFDVFTSSTPFDTWTAIGTAVVVEVPVALLLMGAAIRMLRLSVLRFLVLPTGASFWAMPLMIADDLGDLDAVVDLEGVEAHGPGAVGGPEAAVSAPATVVSPTPVGPVDVRASMPNA